MSSADPFASNMNGSTFDFLMSDGVAIFDVAMVISCCHNCEVLMLESQIGGDTKIL